MGLDPGSAGGNASRLPAWDSIASQHQDVWTQRWHQMNDLSVSSSDQCQTHFPEM